MTTPKKDLPALSPMPLQRQPEEPPTIEAKTGTARTSPPEYPLEKSFTQHPRILACLLLASSICMFFIAMIEIYAISHAYMSGIQTQSTVVEVKANGFPRLRTFEHTLTYEDSTHTTQTAVTTLDKQYEVGAPLSILYTPNNPGSVYQAGAFLAQASYGLGFLALSLFIGLFGISELGKAWPAQAGKPPILTLLRLNKAILPIVLLIVIGFYLAGKSAV